MNKISNTTWAIIKYTKTTDDEFNFTNLKAMLAPIYSDSMNLYNVMNILVNTLMEITDESKFQIHYGKDCIKRAMLSPLNLPLFVEKPNTLTEFYDIIIADILNNIMVTNIGWCRDKLFGDENEKTIIRKND